MRRIGVIGSAFCSDEIMKLSEEVGKEIAKRKGVLICGGLTGVMEGAARGAKKAGGLTIGILPGSNDYEANPFIDVPIVTGFGIARNVVVVRTSEVIIAIQGEYGTLSEIAFALQLKIPIVGLKTWEVSKDIIPADDPVEAVKKAFDLLRP